MQINIKQVQTAIFTNNFNISSDLLRASFLTEINDNSSEVFNGQPIQLPIPNEVPQEVPRFILNSIDSRFSCNIALSRTDIFFNVPAGHGETFDELMNIQKSNSTNIFTFLLSKGVTINRVGFIILAEVILSPEEGDCLNYMKTSFINDTKLTAPKELIINYNHAGSSENFEMNNIFTMSGKAGDQLISLQIDVNTLAEIMNTANFNENNFEEIINHTIQSSKSLIENFPNI